MTKYRITIEYYHSDIVEAEDKDEAMEKADDILNYIFENFLKKYFDIHIEEIQENTDNSNYIADVNNMVGGEQQ